MLVVSDTTPLLYLARVGRLDLLCELYVEVVVPQTGSARREPSSSKPFGHRARARRRSGVLEPPFRGRGQSEGRSARNRRWRTIIQPVLSPAIPRSARHRVLARETVAGGRAGGWGGRGRVEHSLEPGRSVIRAAERGSPWAESRAARMRDVVGGLRSARAWPSTTAHTSPGASSIRASPKSSGCIDWSPGGPSTLAGKSRRLNWRIDDAPAASAVAST